jgi:membrane protein DedA with SNARE-associated domain
MHISVDALHHLLSTWGYLAVFVFVGLESTGIPFPGETMLITAAAYAGAGHLQIPFVIAASALGAITGDNLGYLVGRTGGREVILKYGRYVRLTDDKLDRAQTFFEKHGDKTVFIGRFIAVLRAWAAFLAGVNEMPWKKFFAFNAAGGICWSLLYGILAFVLGHNLPLLERIVKTIGYGGLAIAAVAAIGYIVYTRVRGKRATTQNPVESQGSRSDEPSSPEHAQHPSPPELEPVDAPHP